MYSFDASMAVKYVVEWIGEWFEKNGPHSPAIVGISGGKDSSVVASLCVRALGKERVLGVEMPCGKQKDIYMADRLISFLDIKKYRVNIAHNVEEHGEWLRMNDITISEQAQTNLPARVRMVTLYAIAQSLGGRVANTCNMSENMLGWCTRWGDECGDFSPLENYTVTEVMAMGHELGLPRELVEKVPIDGLVEDEHGMYVTDEDSLSRKLGIENFSYSRYDCYLRGDPSVFSSEELEKLHHWEEGMKFKMASLHLPSPPSYGIIMGVEKKSD